MANEIYVKRIFHPVGQGAFFTEQFFDGKGSCIYSVAYDCGTVSEASLLTHEINYAYKALEDKSSNKPLINCMFISHLDSDHVNGIKILIEKQYITKDTIIFLPLYKDLPYRLILDFITTGSSVSALEIVNLLKDNRIFFIQEYETNAGDERETILYINENSLETESPSDIEDFPEEDGVLTTFPNARKIKGKAGVHIYLKGQNWEYALFNIHGNNEEYKNVQNDFFDAVKDCNQQRQANNLKTFDCNNAHDVIDMFQEYNNKGKSNQQKPYLSELREIYNKLKDRVGKKKSTPINVNSLIVLSKGEEEAGLVKVSGRVGSLIYNLILLSSEIYLNNTSCLYTGDADFSDEKLFGDLMSRIKAKYLKDKNTDYNKICFFQIPHHGSKNNYGEHISKSKDFIFPFVNFDPKHKVFSYKVLFDFVRENRPFIRVTDEEWTRIEVCYSVY